MRSRILAELKRTLARPYFLSRVGATERAAVDSVLRAAGELLPDPIEPPRVLRDLDDDYLLALARAGTAEAIVTGEKDLLEHPGLHPPALTPREARERFLPG